MSIRKSLVSVVSSIVLATLIICLVPCHFVSAEIKDVPKEHWAYQSVKLLVDKGYLGLYGDGTFQGSKSVDRYTLAAVIARILNEIGSGRVGATPEDVELLRKLSGEFREELVLIASELEMFKKTMDEYDKAGQVTKEDIARLTFTQREMKAEVDKLISGIMKDVGELDGRIALVETKLSERIAETHELSSKNESDLRKLEKQVNAHETKVVQLEEDLSATVLRLTSLEPQVADVREDVDSIFAALSQQDAEIASSRQAISQLEGQIAKIEEKAETKDRDFTDELEAIHGKTLSLEEALKSERSARVSTYTSLESGLTSLSTDLAAYKAQTSKDLEGLRKENGLLKVLVGLVAVLGIVIK